GDDEEVLTYDELSNLEEENMCEDLRRMMIIKIHGTMNEITKCHGLMKNHGWKMGFGKNLLMIYVMNANRLVSKVVMLNFPLISGEKMDIVMEEIYQDDSRKQHGLFSILLMNCLGISNNDAIQANQEWFDNHETMEDDDDDIGDLDDYLIPKDAPYYVDEEEEGFKERRRKLLRILYKKPPTFKSKKFKVIKYSFGPAEEYVAIREYEYDIWVGIEENMSNVYQEIFHKKDEGWFMTKTP
nr:hypothetical protein [Tanacetum cinerariifolium]